MASEETKVLLCQATTTTMKKKKNKKINFSEDKRSQRLNFRKRNSTLKKKAEELATLCGVMVCMVCFGPDGEVVTWPENSTEVGELIDKCKVINAKEGHAQTSGIRSCNLLEFLLSQKEKAEDKFRKGGRERRWRRWLESARTSKGDEGDSHLDWNERLNQFSEAELPGLCNSLEQKLQNLREKICMIQERETENRSNNQFSMAANDQCYQPPSQALCRLNDECFGDQPVQGHQQPSQALCWENGECFGEQPVQGYQRPSQALGWLNAECSSEQLVQCHQPLSQALGWLHGECAGEQSVHCHQPPSQAIGWLNGECSGEQPVQCHQPPSQALDGLNGECSGEPRVRYQAPSQALGGVNGECFADRTVLAAPVVSEAWPEPYYRHIWSTNNNSSNNKNWPQECYAEGETVLAKTTTTAEIGQPCSMISRNLSVFAKPINGEDWSSKNNNTRKNLLVDPNWFWGTSDLCFYD